VLQGRLLLLGRGGHFAQQMLQRCWIVRQ